MSKKQKTKDRHLDVPAEANRDKHANFLADDRSETDPSANRSSGAPNEDSTRDNKKTMYHKPNFGDTNNEQ